MILAFITVYKCDFCPAVFIAKTDDDYRRFEKDWFDGCLFQYCPDCMKKREPQSNVCATLDPNFTEKYTVRIAAKIKKV